jgi:hypothetical protein
MEFDSDCIVAGGGSEGNGEVHIWRDSEPSGKSGIFHRDETGKTVFSVAISTDGNYLSAGFQNGLVRVWAIPGIDILQPPPFLFEIYHSLSPVTALTFLTDDLLLSAASNGKLRITSVSEARHVGQIDAHQGSICSVVSLGGRVVASLGVDGILKIWDMDSFRCEYQKPGFHFPREARFVFPSLAFSEETGHLCCPSRDGRLHIFDLHSLCRHEAFDAHHGSFYAVAACGNSLATGGFKDQFVRLWDLKKKALVSEFNAQASVTKLCSLGTKKIAAICSNSKKTGSIQQFTVPGLKQKIFKCRCSFHSMAAFPPKLCELLSHEQTSRRKEGMITEARSLFLYPEKMQPSLQALTDLGFEDEAVLLQAESAAKRNKPLHELRYLLQIVKRLTASRETLPVFRRLAALLEHCREPGLAIDVFERTAGIDGGCEKDIRRLKIHPLLNLDPATTIRLDLAHPTLLAQEIEKNDVLKQLFRWSIVIPSRDRRIFTVKSLHDLNDWEHHIREVTISKENQIGWARENIVLFDGQKRTSTECLIFSHVALHAPSEDAYYFLAVRSENGMTQGEGYGVFRPPVSNASDDVPACNASVAEMYHSLCTQKDMGEWLIRVHEIMIKLDKQAYMKRS